MSRPLFAALLLSLAGAAAPQGHGRCQDRYRVHRGDTLYSLARHCGTSVAALARASRVRNPNRIEVGQRLYFPGAARREMAAAARQPVPVPAAAPRGSAPGVYRIAAGDTLYSLARWSRTDLPTLLAANPGVEPNKIEIGDPIRLPTGAARPELARARERGGAAPAPAPRAGPAPAPRAAESPRARAPQQSPRPERQRESEPAAM